MPDVNINTVGVVDGVDIVVNLSMFGAFDLVMVRLILDYNAQCQYGFASRPGFCGREATLLDIPRRYPAGTALLLFNYEASALIAAGAAIPL